jgi:hypothetical protein
MERLPPTQLGVERCVQKSWGLPRCVLRDRRRKTTGLAPTQEAVRRMVSRLRERLGIAEGALAQERRGAER